MNLKFYITLFSVSISLYVLRQNQPNYPSQNKNNKIDQKMDISKITNPKVRQAVEAWQNGDNKTFLSFFTANPQLTDDGSPRDFSDFVKNACGNEKFLTIDKVENEGKDVYGNFHAGQWGTFRTFFKFHQNIEGKFDRLDIGQAN